MTTFGACCSSPKVDYWETLHYFDTAQAGGLRLWAARLSGISLSARVFVVEPPLAKTDIRTVMTWRRHIPHCLRSQTYYRENADSYAKLFSDMAEYGYPKEQLQNMDEEFGRPIVAKLLERASRGAELRIKDVLELMTFVRQSSAELAHQEELESEGREALERWNDEEIQRKQDRLKAGLQIRDVCAFIADRQQLSENYLAGDS